MAIKITTLIATLSLSALTAACGSEVEIVNNPERDPNPTDAILAEIDPNLPVILAFGDSLTAGHGVDRQLSYPAQLQNELDRLGYDYNIVNHGIDGDTTSGGLARLDAALAVEPEIVILELGGNDGLRGIPIEVVRENLRSMIIAFKEIGSLVIVAGMTLPLNYGPDYIRSFESVYVELSEEFDVAFVPFFTDAILENYERYIQPDGTHPTGEGYTLVVGNILETLEPLLTK